MDFLSNVFRSLLFFFDQIIYGFIPKVYDFIEILAKQTLFSEGEIKGIADNIYAILGVFMLFRVAFILLNAIIDPDKLTDKERGASKVFTRLVVAIILIVAIPFAFDYAFRLQNAILESNVISKIIIGTDANAETASAGNEIGRTTLSAFISCKDNSTDCQTNLGNAMKDAFPANGATSSFSALSDLINAKNTSGNEDYTYNYTPGISTVCGGFILALLISFCFDVAVRIVKLGFLQLISPIAVVGYIEPKGEVFSKWLKMCISTFINLFVRLITISFVVYIIILVKNMSFFGEVGDTTTDPTTAAFIKIFVIIGALIFAKEAPKMISKLLNIEEGTVTDINPFKKLGAMAGAGFIGGATALALKPVAGTVGALGGGMASSAKGGSFKAGAMEGFTKGAKGITGKGGVGNLGKQLGGVAGAWRQGSNAGATIATGKDTKTGIINDIGQKYHDAASEAQRQYANTQADAKGKELFDKFKQAKANNEPNPYSALYSSKYAQGMQELSNYKSQLKNYGNQRQFFANRYQIDPDGKYQYNDADGNIKEITNKQAFEIASSNYNTAEKYVNNAKSAISEMDKLPTFKADAENRSLLESYENKQTPEFKDVPTPSTDQMHSTGSGSSYTRNASGEKTTASGIVLPNNYGDDTGKK